MDQDIAMANDDSEKTQLFAVHMCATCGHGILRSEMESQALISGVVECAKCGNSGPLNVVIRSLEDKKPPKRSTDEG